MGDTAAMLTDKEKRRVDPHGYLVLRGFIDAGRLEAMLAIHCSHLATWVTPADVPDGAGFCLVPGSHESDCRAPADLPVAHAPPTSIAALLSAGDAIVFATSLLHDASAWTEETPRLSILQGYQLSVYFNEGGKAAIPRRITAVSSRTSWRRAGARRRRPRGAPYPGNGSNDPHQASGAAGRRSGSASVERVAHTRTRR